MKKERLLGRVYSDFFDEVSISDLEEKIYEYLKEENITISKYRSFYLRCENNGYDGGDYDEWLEIIGVDKWIDNNAQSAEIKS